MSDTADLTRRVGDLEKKVGEIAVSVGELRTEMKHVATKTWVFSGVVLTLVTVIGAAWWMAQQYLGPILQGLPKH